MNSIICIGALMVADNPVNRFLNPLVKFSLISENIFPVRLASFSCSSNNPLSSSDASLSNGALPSSGVAKAFAHSELKVLLILPTDSLISSTKLAVSFFRMDPVPLKNSFNEDPRSVKVLSESAVSRCLRVSVSLKEVTNCPSPVYPIFPLVLKPVNGLVKSYLFPCFSSSKTFDASLTWAMIFLIRLVGNP